MISNFPPRRRQLGGALICVPLVAVVGLWAWSYSGIETRQIAVAHSRYQLTSMNGYLQLERLAESNPNGASVSGERVDLPYCGIWLAVAMLTIALHFRMRTTSVDMRSK